ncbi:large ribosomal subunit protein uL30m isoform X2 [Callithrix jacchus]|uniref:39S ribosomal protein L30, mitochondrial isoform X2 n=1 Tax=Callithrix jacchus TaxID=9483 RepID=UPI0023DD5A4C|nr:39S ribosomal protein L30, mitochondrial isoform X2 [Callithrix jacchus]
MHGHCKKTKRTTCRWRGRGKTPFFITPGPLKRAITTLMAGILRLVAQRPPGRLQVFQASPEDHEKYGGDPQNPHKLHIVTRIKSTKRRPYWEKDVIKMLKLEKAHTPQVHKNIPSVNAKLKVVKHLIRIKPLKLPQGLPTEENMSNTCLKSTGELVVQWHLKPVEQKADEA